MFVKQIDKNKALELAAKGMEIYIMQPDVPVPKEWSDYTPILLSTVLDGSLFFRRVPAMESEILPTEPEADGQNDTDGGAESTETPLTPKVEPKNKKTKNPAVDIDKMLALRAAGWSFKKIAEEMRISEGSAFNYIKAAGGK